MSELRVVTGARSKSSGTGTPSNKSLTQFDLKKRQIEFLPIAPIEGDLEEYPTSMQMSLLEKLEVEMQTKLDAPYTSESMLRQAIFDATIEIFEGTKAAESDTFQFEAKEKDRIVFSFKDQKLSPLGYFIGLIQECRDDFEMRPDLAMALFRRAVDKDKKSVRRKKPSKKNVSDGLSSSATRTKSAYELDSYLAIMELKMADGSLPSDFQTLKKSLLGDPTYADNSSNFLNQELSYVIRRVCAGLSSCGISLDHVPLYVIVGKRNDKDSASQLCCLEGELMGAETCCDLVQYAIKKFVVWPKVVVPGAEKPVSGSAKQASTIFRRFMHFGFAVALEALQNFLKQVLDKSYCVIQPMSGKRLFLRGQAEQHVKASSVSDVTAKMQELSVLDPDVQLYPSDFLAIVATPAARRLDTSFEVSQADLFQGTLSREVMKRLRLPRSDGIKILWFHFPPESLIEENYDVIVKVSSSAVHPQVVPPYLSFRALQLAYNNDSLRDKLSKVILVVFKLRLGLVTIMRDLSKKDYMTLCPKDLPKISLWNAVSSVVEEEFLPLASIDIIHNDLRPGSDVTSNILVKKTGADQFHLMAIDYDSLVEHEALSLLIGIDGRFLHHNIAPEAIGMLWWQCLSFAYVWEKGLIQDQLKDGMNLTYELKELSARARRRTPTDDFERSLFEDIHVHAILCGTIVISNAAQVKTLLKLVSEYFEIRDSVKIA